MEKSKFVVSHRLPPGPRSFEGLVPRRVGLSSDYLSVAEGCDGENPLSETDRAFDPLAAQGRAEDDVVLRALNHLSTHLCGSKRPPSHAPCTGVGLASDSVPLRKGPQLGRLDRALTRIGP